MTAYIIADIVINDAQRFQDYAAAVPGIIRKHAGRYIVRGGDPAAKEGDWQPQRLVVIEFPDRQHAEAFLADPDYVPVAALRHESATTRLVIVEGYEDG